MNTAPLKRTLSVTGLLLTGAFCGVAAVKLVAPKWFAPGSANAFTLPGAAPIDSAPVQPISIKPQPPATRPASASSPPKSNPFVLSDEARKRSLCNQLLTCRSQIELYRLQHHDKAPDFAKYPAWHQLTHATRPDGAPFAKGGFGPYLREIPVNPLNGFGSIGLVRKDPKPGQVMPGDKLGFIFCVSTSHLFATAKDGKTIFDETSVADAPASPAPE